MVIILNVALGGAKLSLTHFVRSRQNILNGISARFIWNVHLSIATVMPTIARIRVQEALIVTMSLQDVSPESAVIMGASSG